MTWRLAGLLQLLVAAFLAAAAVGIAGWATPDPGVAAGGQGSNVSWVLPGGPSWVDGIRPGQIVLELKSGLEPTSWRLATSNGETSFATNYISQLDRLRDSVPLALGAAALALVALLVAARMTIGVAVALISALLSASALAASGMAALTTVAFLAALVLPAVWLAIWSGRRTRIGVVLATSAIVVGAAWLAARFTVPALFDTVDSVRQAGTVGVDLAVVLSLADLRRWQRRLLNLDSRRAADVVAVIGVAAVAVFVWLAFTWPVALTLVVGAAAILLYPGFRRRLASTMDQLVLGEIRDRASIRAVEEERSRIARDLHDAPLQDIAAVIRQLDRRPDTSRETDLLRGVADRLRQVTTELRPPILDDLGLRAAISYLGDNADQANENLEVQVRLLPDDPLTDRPPRDVELAFYRILREAVDNAVRHAEARHLSIAATVLASYVDASVEDDGRGMGPTAARDAARAGHLGLLSMAQRAAIIGAEFALEGVAPHGTRVRVSWRAAT
jgi:signal transduction histidine kinase